MTENNSIVTELRQQLVFGQFLPGQRLQPEKIRSAFGCSANTVRESLFRLFAEGLVDFFEQRGFRAPKLSNGLLRELTLMRILLEAEGTRLSLINGTLDWEARLTAAHHKLDFVERKIQKEQNTDQLVEIWANAELEFHTALIDACGSDTLIQNHRRIYNRFRQQVIYSDRSFGRLKLNNIAHKRILDAALSRDVKAMEAAGESRLELSA